MASANASGAIAPGTQPVRRANHQDDPNSSEYEFHQEDPDAHFDIKMPRRLPRLPSWMLIGDTPEENAKDVLRLRSEQLPRHYTRTEYAVLSEYIQNIFVVANWAQFAGMTAGAWRSYNNPDLWPWDMKGSKNIGSGPGAPGAPDGGKPPQSPFEFRSRNNPWRPPWSSTSGWWDAARQQQQHQQQPPSSAEGAEAASKQHTQGQQQTQQQQTQQQQPKFGQNKPPPTEEEVKAFERSFMRRLMRQNWSLGYKFMFHMIFGHAIGGVIGITFAGTWVNSQEAKDPRLANYHRDRKAFLAQETQRRRSESMERRRRAMPQSPSDGTPNSDQESDPIGLYGNDETAQDRTPASTPAPVTRSPISFRRQPQPKPVEDDSQSLGGADADSELFWGDDKPADSSSTASASGNSRWRARDQHGQDSQSHVQARAKRTDNSGSSSRAEPQPTYDSGGSAWERIRREAAESQGGSSDESSWSRARRNVTGGSQSKQDSFTFSDSDRSRSLAKEEAQKDFDERVDRERRGEEGWK